MNQIRLNRLPSWLHEWFPEILFLLVTSGAGVWAGGRWLDPVGDPSFSWSLAHRLAQGEILYRDVFVGYGPLSPYLLAMVARYFGTSALSVLLANWVPAALAGLLLLRCGRPLLSTLERIALVGVLLANSLFVSGAGRLVYPYYAGVVHALALSVAALWLLQRRGGRKGPQAYAAGLLSGLAFCAKQEIGVAAFLALFTPVLMRFKESAVWVTRLLAGFATVLGLAALVLFSSAPLESLQRRNYLWPLNLNPPQRFNRFFLMVAGVKDPNWPDVLCSILWTFLCCLILLSALGLLTARESDIRRWIPTLGVGAALVVWGVIEGYDFQPALFPISLSMTVAFLVAFLALLQPHHKDKTFLVGFGVFAGLAGARTAFSSFVSGHYDGPAHLASSLTWVVFLCVFFPRLMASGEKASVFTRRIVAAVLLVISWSGAIEGIGNLGSPGKQAFDTRAGRIFLEPAYVPFFQVLGRNLKAGEKVLVIPEINAVDVLFGVRSVSPLQHHMPGWLDPDMERFLIRKFEKNPPDAVVIFNRPTFEFGVAPFGEGFGRLLARWISRHYHPVEVSRAGAVLRKESGE